METPSSPNHPDILNFSARDFSRMNAEVRAETVLWRLSCAYPAYLLADPEKRETLHKIALQGDETPALAETLAERHGEDHLEAWLAEPDGKLRERLHTLVADWVTPLPFPEKQAIRTALRIQDKDIYSNIGHWQWVAFNDIPYLSNSATQHWLREVESDDLLRVCRADADGALREKILPNLSNAARELLEQELMDQAIANAPMPTPEELRQSQHAVVEGIRKAFQEQHATTLATEEEHDRLLSLAHAGDAEAQFNLGSIYELGFNGWDEEDREKAAQWYKLAAEQGSTDGMYGLGMICRRLGRHEEALQWFLEGSQHGDCNASIKAGNYYGNDESPFYQPVQAVEYYRKAAEQGCTTVFPRLGAMFASGEGVEQDDAQAREWFRQGAENGDKLCQFHYAQRCEEGLGGERDIQSALNWYEKAAEQHFPEAAFNLGCLNFFDDGLPRDLDVAEKWFLQAAEEGLPVAFYNLGCLSDERDNLIAALKWFLLAREVGHESEAAEIAELTARLTAAEIDIAEVNAAEWKKAHGLLFHA